MKLIFFYAGKNGRVNDHLGINFSKDYKVSYTDKCFTIERIFHAVSVYEAPISELTALIGRNGSGKTTCLQMLFETARGYIGAMAEDGKWICIYDMEKEPGENRTLLLEINSGGRLSGERTQYYFVPCDFSENVKKEIHINDVGQYTEYKEYESFPVSYFYFPMNKRVDWYHADKQSNMEHGVIRKYLLRSSEYMLLRYLYEVLESENPKTDRAIWDMFGGNPSGVKYQVKLVDWNKKSFGRNTIDFIENQLSEKGFLDLKGIYSRTDEERCFYNYFLQTLCYIVKDRCRYEEIDSSEKFEPIRVYFKKAKERSISKLKKYDRKKSINNNLKLKNFFRPQKAEEENNQILYMLYFWAELMEVLREEDSFRRDHILSYNGTDANKIAVVYAIILLLAPEDYEKYVWEILDEKSKKDSLWTSVSNLLKIPEKRKAGITSKRSPAMHVDNINIEIVLKEYRAMEDLECDSLFILAKILDSIMCIAYRDDIDLYIPEVSVANLSTGEIDFINIFASILGELKHRYGKTQSEEKDRNETAILLLDEPDATFHPEWSRRFIYTLNQVLKSPPFSDYPCNYQIILTTHSPILISDIPARDVRLLNYIEKGRKLTEKEEKQGRENGKTYIETSEFGLMSNINDIMISSFFVGKPFGMFAEKFVENLMLEIKEFHGEEQKYRELHGKIQCISEPYVRDVLMRELQKRSGRSRIVFLEKKIREMQEEVEALRKHDFD